MGGGGNFCIKSSFNVTGIPSNLPPRPILSGLRSSSRLFHSVAVLPSPHLNQSALTAFTDKKS
jgi:hypothetical protein